jgi:hypothetical protein
MAKRSKRKKLENKLQKAVNLYCRLRDCAGQCGTKCISYGRWYSFTDLDAGHFIPTTSSATRYDVRNISAQCRKCNRFLQGNGRPYYAAMIQKWGREIVDELMSKEYQVKKWTETELEALLVEIRIRTETLI